MRFNQAPQNEHNISAPVETKENTWLTPGGFVSFEEGGILKRVEILSVLSAQDLAITFGINLQRNIPVYVLKAPLGRSNGAYSLEHDAVFFYPHTTEIVKKHELVHAVERPQMPTEDLKSFFTTVKAMYLEGLEMDGGVLNNFVRDIHEFIAEGYTNPVVNNELTEKGLYDQFLKCTEYLEVLHK